MERKIVVVYKSDNNDTGEALKLLEAAFRQYDPVYIPREKLLEKDTRGALVIVAGGDGTFLGASHRILDNYSLVLGVRLSARSRGFYSAVDIQDLEKTLPRFLTGKEGIDYKVERLDRLECVMHTDSGNWVKTDLALNEFFIANTCSYMPSKYVLIVDGKEEVQRSSGILVCTVQGFYGWVRWAQGHELYLHAPEATKMFLYVREPMLGIKNQERWIQDRCFVRSDMHRGFVVPDSFDEYHFNRGTELEIRVSDKPLNVVKFK
jgi:NAD kinase